MQFPESWLREFCNPALTTQALADKLTMAGLEVEELTPVAPAFSSVVVGEIKVCAQHPNADRLRVCQVDVGQAALLNIVCGAPNARVGIKIPCALVGAELPPAKDAVDGKPFKIKLGQLRGVESQGMLCSAKELGIAEEASGLLVLPADAPVGQSIRQYLDLDDNQFELKLTALHINADEHQLLPAITIFTDEITADRGALSFVFWPFFWIIDVNPPHTFW